MLPDLLERERGVVTIDLKDVLIVDREAIRLLAVRESNGVELRNCSTISVNVSQERRRIGRRPRNEQKERKGSEDV